MASICCWVRFQICILKYFTCDNTAGSKLGHVHFSHRRPQLTAGVSEGQV